MQATKDHSPRWRFECDSGLTYARALSEEKHSAYLGFGGESCFGAAHIPIHSLAHQQRLTLWSKQRQCLIVSVVAVCEADGKVLFGTADSHNNW